MQGVGVDIGGTFTDLVAQDDDGRIAVSKVLTTPKDHAEGVMSAVAKAAVDLRRTALFLHGSTIDINTVVERKGVKTALIATRGFRDVYEIGRSNRPDAYNLFFERPVPLVPRSLRREVTERMAAQGGACQRRRNAGTGMLWPRWYAKGSDAPLPLLSQLRVTSGFWQGVEKHLRHPSRASG